MGRVLPILFNTDMVRAILDGRKTVTRRICKDANEYTVPDMGFYDSARRTYAVHHYTDKMYKNQVATAERLCLVCPRDILYVRETWCNVNRNGIEPEYYYYADTRMCEDYDSREWKWRPSIHMPKAAARIWLKVTNVRVERLQDITEEQAIKEGITCVKYDVNTGKEESAALDWFPILWDSTVKKSDSDRYGWDANPWVWVIGFERCGNPEKEKQGVVHSEK